MTRFILSLIFASLSFSFVQIQAQELNAKLTINTQQLPSANKDLFSSLERELNQMLNDQEWSNATFNKNERINCNVTITINEVENESFFSGTIQFTSQRPVYNSSYVTPLINYRDTEFQFNYMQGQSLDYSTNYITDNLVAVVSFYAYIIIGLDFDSFSPNGGSPYFTKAMDIANMAQSLNTKGWEAFSGKNNNRYDLAVALTEESSRSFHSFWYNYHRMGLDEMAANPSRSRIRIIEAINDIQQLYDARPSSLLLIIIGETKLDEIVRICSQATAEEKQNIKKTLNRIFPTKGTTINMLK